MSSLSDNIRRTPPLAIALFCGALLAGLAFPLWEPGLAVVQRIAAKGLGVGLLALAALGIGTLPQRLWLAAIMAAGALGDVLLEIPGLFFVGAGAFAVGHCIAILFYARNPGARRGLGRLAALALIGWGLAMPALVSPAGTPVGALMLYSVLLCGMAAALLLSRFSRLAVAGALLFVVSDTLLIMRLGGSLVGTARLHGLLVWYSYFLGQALIFAGVATGLVEGRSR